MHLDCLAEDEYTFAIEQSEGRLSNECNRLYGDADSQPLDVKQGDKQQQSISGVFQWGITSTAGH